MASKGWIKIFRELQDHWIWNNAEYLKAWIDILLTANREESKTLIDNKIVTMPEGSIITSEVKLAARWGWSRKKVRNFLSCLESDQMLVIKRDSRGTALTVVNWAKFQGKGTAKGTAKEQPKNSSGYSSGTPNKNIRNKELNNNKYIYSRAIADIVQYLNEKTGSHYQPSTRKTQDLIKARLKEGFTVEDFYKVINIKTAEWLHNPEMMKYLRPETLFGTKFEGYLNQPVQKTQEEMLLDWAEEADRREQEDKNG